MKSKLFPTPILYGIVLLLLLLLCNSREIWCSTEPINMDAADSVRGLNCQRQLTDRVTLGPNDNYRISCANVNPKYRYRLKIKVRDNTSPISVVMYQGLLNKRVMDKRRLQNGAKLSKILLFATDETAELYLVNENSLPQTVKYEFSMERGITEELYIITMVIILPYAILSCIICIGFCGLFIFACTLNQMRKRRRRERRRQELLIEFKEPKTLDKVESRYLMEMKKSGSLKDLPVAPVLNILDYLELKVNLGNSPMLLFLTPKRKLEQIIMKQLFGVFVRHGYRDLYLLYTFADFSECSHALRWVPHCSRLTDVYGISIDCWNRDRWNNSHNKKLKRLNLRKSTVHLWKNDEEISDFVTSIENVNQIALREFDYRLIKQLVNQVKHLEITDEIKAEAHYDQIAALKQLEHLSLGSVYSKRSLEILLAMEGLKSMYIWDIGSSITRPEWSPHGTSLSKITIYKSNHSVELNVPMYSEYLEFVKLGRGIKLCEESFTYDMIKSEASSLVQTVDLSGNPSVLKILSVVEEMPSAFMNPNILKRFPYLRKLSITVSSEVIPILGNLCELEELRVLQLRVSGKPVSQVSVEPLADMLITLLPKLETLLLFNSLMATKIYINQDGFMWQKTKYKS